MGLTPMTRAQSASRRPGSPLTVCILAGGLGTRLGEVARHTPKALVPVAGQPFILYQLRSLAEQGITNVVLCVGHMGQMIEREIGDNRFGLAISYSYDGPNGHGTLGAILKAQVQLGSRFFYLYGDTILHVDYQAVERVWRDSKKPAVMTVIRNAGPWGNSNVDFEGGLVRAYDKSAPAPRMQWIDYGLGGLSPEALALAPVGAHDLSSLHSLLAAQRLLLGYEVTERFYEIGTPASLEETTRYLVQSGLSLAQPQEGAVAPAGKQVHPRYLVTGDLDP
jgi:N-acetyl-alpha-D-muramate 1-phosphate uridylyltransferase